MSPLNEIIQHSQFTWPGCRVLALPELLRWSRNIKGLRNTTMSLPCMTGNPLMNDAQLSQTVGRAKNATPRPLCEPDGNCAEFPALNRKKHLANKLICVYEAWTKRTSIPLGKEHV